MSVHSRLPHQPSLIRLLCALALATSALVLGHPPTAAAATFTVTKTSDSKDGACNSDCSLREAIIAAHQQAGVDTITLRAGTYRVTLSDLDITSSLNIVGAGAATTIIESNGEDRVFEVRPDTTVTIDKVTIRNGKLIEDNGGGISNQGTLTLSNSTVSANLAEITYSGGGIYSTGSLTVTNSTISGNSAYRGSGIYSTGPLTVTNSTISGNVAPAGGGGGIWSQGTAMITNSIINGNSASGGAGIWNRGTATVTNSTISGNSGSTYGGGINNSAATLTISHSIISNNTVSGMYGNGGGIINSSGTVTISHSTISANEARVGGGIDNSGSTMVLTNTTISGNSAYDGGGIWTQNTVTLTNSTVSSNSASNQGGGIFIVGLGNVALTNSTVSRNSASNQGGGIFNVGVDGTTASNTILAGNSGLSSAPECSGPLISQGYNLIGNTAGCAISGDTTGNQTGINPQLGPLQNNGGATFTHLPLSGSPAIDAGNTAAPGSGGSACAPTDQRGQSRPTDGNGDGIARCDIGAVER